VDLVVRLEQTAVVEHLALVAAQVHLEQVEQVELMELEELVVLLELVGPVEVLVQAEALGLQEQLVPQAHLELLAPQVKMVYLEDLYTILTNQ
jgi:hypothetical protein